MKVTVTKGGWCFGGRVLQVGDELEASPAQLADWQGVVKPASEPEPEPPPIVADVAPETPAEPEVVAEPAPEPPPAPPTTSKKPAAKRGRRGG
jgi:hypothetical protein